MPGYIELIHVFGLMLVIDTGLKYYLIQSIPVTVALRSRSWT